jgi:hypothetical protein
MFRPAYNITLGAATVSDAQPGPLDALQVRRDKRGNADEAIVRFGAVSAPVFAEGDPAAIELGWDGSTSVVFTGTVERIARGISRVEAYCSGAQLKLMRGRTDQAFVSQNAGQVVTALAGTAGVPTETVEDGIDLPAYYADSARPLFTHCTALARVCGFDLYTTGEGKLVFAPFSTSSAGHTFRYGSEILAITVETTEPSLDAVTAVPESPASSAGDDKASWLVKTSSAHQGTAGSGSASVLVSDPLLRTRDAAESSAKARLYFALRDAVSGELEIQGAPDLDLDQAAELSGVPSPGVDGVYQIMGIMHSLDTRRGFRTTVSLGGMP